MKVTKRLGRLRMRLDGNEVALLESLFDELNELFADETARDDVIARLFPSAYPDDPGAEDDYRSITEDALRSDRRERIALCAADLAAGPDVDLSDPDVSRRWIQVLNDLRLALGTRLGVTEDLPRISADDPALHAWVIYQFLTHLQDSVVTALTA